MSMLSQDTGRAIAAALAPAPAAKAPAALGTITLMVTAHAVAERLPDVDTDVLIFDGPNTEAQLGAYMGDDDDDGQPIWVEAQGSGVAGVTHWAELPKLSDQVDIDGAKLAAHHLAAAGAEWRARAQRAEGERQALLALLLDADCVLSTLEGENGAEADMLERLRARILRASQPLRPAEADLLGVRAGHAQGDVSSC